MPLRKWATTLSHLLTINSRLKSSWFDLHRLVGRDSGVYFYAAGLIYYTTATAVQFSRNSAFYVPVYTVPHGSEV